MSVQSPVEETFRAEAENVLMMHVQMEQFALEMTHRQESVGMSAVHVRAWKYLYPLNSSIYPVIVKTL